MTFGTGIFAGYLDVPLFTPSWAPVAAIATYPQLSGGWHFNPSAYIPMPYANPRFTNPNTFPDVVTAMTFDVTAGAKTELVNPTGTATAGFQGSNYWNGKLVWNQIAAGPGNVFHDVGFNIFNPSTPYNSFHTLLAGPPQVNLFDPIVINNPAHVPSPYQVMLLNGLTTEIAPQHIYMWDPYAATNHQIGFTGGMQGSFYFSATQVANAMDIHANGGITGINRLFVSQNTNHGPQLMQWQLDQPNAQVVTTPTLDIASLNAFIQGTGIYSIGVKQDGFILMFNTGGTGPTGQHCEIALVDLDWQHYYLLRFRPQDAGASAQIGRLTNAWSVTIDVAGVLWFNSGAGLDAASPLASIGMVPWPLPQDIPLDLPCFNPCPVLP